jgi:hypothetical protein
MACGEMPERPNGHDWKSCVRPKGVPGVRIPLSPPEKLNEGTIAGPRATKGCEPRQVRKEAAATISDVCYGKPGYPFLEGPISGGKADHSVREWSISFLQENGGHRSLKT